MEEKINKTCGECKHFEVDVVAAKCKKKFWICDDDTPTCKKFEPRVVTNGDVIRQMSNEELAKIISNVDCKICPAHMTCFNEKNETCFGGFLAWLNAPAESEGEDE